MWDSHRDWQQTGSFWEPVPIPGAHPEAAPVVCVRVNQDWIPYICGALTQLLQRTTWDTPDKGVLNETLGEAMDLISIISNAKVCQPVRFRLQACVLQFSEDDGVSWADVEGWSTTAGTCFTGPAGPAGATGATGPAGPAGAAGASGASVASRVLDYSPTNLVLNAILWPLVFTDVFADQSFTIANAASLVEFSFVSGLLVGNGCEARLVVDASSASPIYLPIGGAESGFSSSGMNGVRWLSGLSAGVHNVRLQVRAYYASSYLYCVTDGSIVYSAGLNLSVIEHTPTVPAAGAPGATGPAGPAGAAGAAGATGPAGAPCGCPPAGIPPNVKTEPNPQRACDIASFLASDFIKQALQTTIDEINAGHTILNIFTAIAVLIPIDLPADIAAIALNGLYTAITAGTLADFEAAAADSTLWSSLTCAIFHAIEGVGYVDSTNFAAMEAAICGFSYAHPDVITAICQFVSNLGLAGVQTAQNAGALAVGDCSGCGAWCYQWPLGNSGAGSWTITQGTFDAITGWSAVDGPGIPGQLVIDIHFPPTNITYGQVTDYTSSNNGSAPRAVTGYYLGGVVAAIGMSGGAMPGGETLMRPGFAGLMDHIQIVLNTDAYGMGTSTASIASFIVHGVGVCPFGSPNC